MKILTHDDIMCMANVRGKDVRTPCPFPFSFYFFEQEITESRIPSKGIDDMRDFFKQYKVLFAAV